MGFMDFVRRIFGIKPKEVPRELPPLSEEVQLEKLGKEIREKEKPKKIIKMPDGAQRIIDEASKEPPKEPPLTDEQKEKLFDELKAKQEAKKSRQATKRAGSLSSATSLIRDEGRTEIVPQLGNWPELEQQYRDLIYPKVNGDEEITQILIENRRKLKHRFIASVTIVGEDGSPILTAEIIGILPEELEAGGFASMEGEVLTFSEIKSRISSSLEDIKMSHGFQHSSLSGASFTGTEKLGKPVIRVSFA